MRARVLYDSQHSRTAPLARPLLFRVSSLSLSLSLCILVLSSRYVRRRERKTRRHHPYIMHGLMLFLFNTVSDTVYNGAGPIRETLNPRASFFTAI